MKINTNNILEFNIILEHLSELALSERAKEKLLLLKPFLSESECKAKIRETTETLKILESMGNPPLASMKELDKILTLTERDAMLLPEQLSFVATFIASCRRMKSYLKKAEVLGVEIAFYGGALDEMELLFEEINRCIRNERVEDNASAILRDIRRKIEKAHLAVKTKLEAILSNKKQWFTDGYVASRNGHFVLPVKKEYKNQVSGLVIDTSATGGTCFIEPSAVRKLQEEISTLQIDEDNEIRKILYTLTALVDEHISVLKNNMDCMESLDFTFAKAKLSVEMRARPVPIGTERKMVIKGGRHPLLNPSTCVPLDFEIGGDISGVIITGPNTGGKTVSLKTVGLLSLMAQSGLHVPVDEGSVFCMHSSVLCDIGDGQSITENLSTFSSHITNIIDILKNLSNESLVLLDELGSGTDPAEGMGIAVSILEELRAKGCLFVATTHYPEIKEYAKNTDRLINARMEFDRENLQPLYKLEIGEAGESCALYIARRLGFPEHMLKRAHTEAYGHKSTFKRENSDMEFSESASEDKNKAQYVAVDKIQRESPRKNEPPKSAIYQIGDSVTVYPQCEIGIIYRQVSEKGELGVQIHGEKQLINHKRIKLLTSASELYPENYDFSIIFDSVENRKARHQMEKRHSPDLVIEYGKENL